MDLNRYQQQEFDLAQLVQAAGALIERIAPETFDGRVAERPDARTVRYYQTIEAVQKPLRYKGRRAVYGYIHLLQLVGVKWLQAQGLSLEQIQRVMAQASVRELEEELRAAFQREGRRVEEGLPDAHAPGIRPGLAQQRDQLVRELRNIAAYELAPGMTLIIDPRQVMDPDAAAVRIAAHVQRARKHQGGRTKNGS